MQYVEMVKMPIEEAKRRCKKNAIILVATQDLEDDDIDAVFIPKKRDECDEVFENVETVASLCDDLVKQLKLFTEKQDLRNIKPCGILKTVILEE